MKYLQQMTWYNIHSCWYTDHISGMNNSKVRVIILLFYQTIKVKQEWDYNAKNVHKNENHNFIEGNGNEADGVHLCCILVVHLPTAPGASCAIANTSNSIFDSFAYYLKLSRCCLRLCIGSCIWVPIIYLASWFLSRH